MHIKIHIEHMETHILTGADEEGAGDVVWSASITYQSFLIQFGENITR